MNPAELLEIVLPAWRRQLPERFAPVIEQFIAAERRNLAVRLRRSVSHLSRQQVPLIEQFGHLAAPDARPSAERVRAEQEAELIFAQLARLLPTMGDAVDPEYLNTILFALEDLEAVPIGHESADRESIGSRDEDWYDEASELYDQVFLRPDQLPEAIGVDWEPAVAADLISAFWLESERFGGSTPDWLFKVQIADTIFPDPRFGKIELRVVPKDIAYEFVKEHHSALGGKAKLPPGIMYALGAYIRGPYIRKVGDEKHHEFAYRPELVAVALAGAPTGNWKGRGEACGPKSILDLHRVASVSGLYTVNRKGHEVPLNAASMLTARIMDLLPQSSRTGGPGCLFVTYSLASEAGTTYLSLVSRGLRPVELLRGRAASGTRSGGEGTALNAEDKIRWEYGPAALPPEWSTLKGVVDEERIRGANVAYAVYDPTGSFVDFIKHARGMTDDDVRRLGKLARRAVEVQGIEEAERARSPQRPMPERPGRTEAIWDRLGRYSGLFELDNTVRSWAYWTKKDSISAFELGLAALVAQPEPAEERPRLPEDLAEIADRIIALENEGVMTPRLLLAEFGMFAEPRAREHEERRDAAGRIIRPLTPPPAMRRHIESTAAPAPEQLPDVEAIRKRLADAGIVGNDFVRQLTKLRLSEIGT